MKKARKMIEKTAIAGCLAATMIASAAEKEKFPIYESLPLPRPENLKTFSEEDFAVDTVRISKRTGKSLFVTPEGLVRMAGFYRETPEGRQLWKNLSKQMVKILNGWDLLPANFNRYTYRFSQLRTAAYVYALSGCPELGEFVRGHILQASRLPMEFWLHAELRGYNREAPTGGLETAQVSGTVAIVMALADDLFTPEEKEEVQSALREKGLIPCLRFVRARKQSGNVNNWLAVVATGAYLSAGYLGDEKALDEAGDALLWFVNAAVEDDGSYGEGIGYFDYPVGSIIPAIAAMPQEERREFLAGSGLRRSAEWTAYPYLYGRLPDGSPDLTRLHFGDNSFWGRPTLSLLALLSELNGDPLARYLGDTFGQPGWEESQWNLALAREASIPEVKPRSPEELGLPLVRSFDNGENFIRSSWEPGALLLSLYTAGPTRVNYGHQRPERNAVTMAAKGEYFLISPGSASYRSPIHYEYDQNTLAANTISIDGKSQLYPGNGQATWGRRPPEQVASGRPQVTLEVSRAGKNVNVLVADAAKSYQPKLQHARRMVVQLKKNDAFAVIDRIVSEDGPHTYTSRFHFNNRDRQGKLADLGGGAWSFSRPKADLGIRLDADIPVEVAVTDGYMHGKGRDYSPGGEHEGWKGSARVLEITNPEPAEAVTFVAVFQPLEKEAEPLPVSRRGNRLLIGADLIEWDDRGLLVTADGETERFPFDGRGAAKNQ